MKKKILVILLVFSFVFSSLPIAGLAENSQFSETFEEALLNSALSTNNYNLLPSGLIGTVVEDPENKQNKVFLFDANDSEDGQYYFFENKALFTHLPNGTNTIEFDLYFPAKLGATDNFYVQFFTGECSIVTGASRNDVPYQFVIAQGDKLKLGNGTVLGSYPIKKWFTLRYVIHNDGSFDVNMIENGTQTEISSGMMPPEAWSTSYLQHGIKKFRFCYTYGGGTKNVYVDNLKAYVGLPKESNGATQWSVPASYRTQSYEKDATLLSLLGIYSNENIVMEEHITRAQMADIAIKTVGVNYESNYASIYSDVTAEHPLANSIQTARGLGIISAADTFKPDSSVSVLDAAVMLMRAVGGYDAIANARGGYPTGYLTTAIENKLFKNLVSSTAMPLTTADMLCLVNNVLSLDATDFTVSTENIELFESGISVMEKYFNVHVFSDILKTVGGASFDTPLEDEFIKVGNTVIKNAFPYAREYLGYKVDCYYKNDSGTYTSLFVYPTKNVNAITTVKANDIQSVSENAIRYRDGDRNASASLNNPTILYNGHATSFDKTLLENADKLTLICNDGSKKANVVLIDKYKSFVVESVSADIMKITSQDGKETLELSDKESVNIIKNNEKSSIKSIKVGNVISVATERLPALSSLNAAQYFDIYISTKKISGEISEIDGDGKIKIGDSWYDVMPEVNAKLRDSGDWLFDINDTIIARTNIGYSSGEYGILLALGKDGHLSKEIQFKIFTAENKSEIFSCQKKLKVNDEVLKDDEIISALTPLIGMEVIKYDVGMYGELLAIYTPTDCSNASFDGYYIGYKEDGFTKNFDGTSYSYASNILTHSQKWNNQTLVFEGELGKTGEDDYKISDPNLFGAGAEHRLKVYDTQNTGFANVVFLVRKAAEPQLNDAFSQKNSALVTEVRRGTDENDEEFYQFNILMSGVETSFRALEGDDIIIVKTSSWKDNVTYPLSKRDKLEMIKPGDILQYEVGKDGFANAIHVLYNSNRPFEEMEGVITDKENIYNYMTVTSTSCGIVNEIKGNFINITAAPERSFYIDDTTSITVVDMTNNEFYTATKSDIHVGDKVFIKSLRVHSKELYILR